MRSDIVESLVAKIHDSDAQLAMAVTGGGTLAISSLLAAPGGSRTVLECVVPYSASALAEFLGAAPEHYCSEGAARAMAMVAFVRAGRLGAEWRRRVGIGCTASLATDRPKRGEHRLHAAYQTGSITAVASLTLQKGRRTRAEEEQLAAALVLNQVAEAAGVADRLPLELVDAEAVEMARHDALPLWQELWSGRASKIAAVGAASGAGDGTGVARPAVVFPGAFNPLHHGHLRMAEVGASLLGSAPAWELSIQNADKPPLDYLEVSRRLAQFEPASAAVASGACPVGASVVPAGANVCPGGAHVWLTAAARFVTKAELFPGATFLVGADTILRIDDPRYYGHSAPERDAAIRAIADHGCKFLVFGRLIEPAADASDVLHAATFRTLSQLALSPGLKAICLEAPAEKFREDVSSTALRRD